ncbi:hypothetical protein QQ045_012114 [Rhodiola kirilowii]
MAYQKRPPTPTAAVRDSSLRGTYTVNFPDDACQWGANPRPMIELGDMPDASFPWDCQPEYLNWWEQMISRFSITEAGSSSTSRR